MLATPFRLRKHADYQRVYQTSRKQFAKQMTWFFSLRAVPTAEAPGPPRIGVTAGKVLGNAVERNRIKRRMRAAIRMHLPLLSAPVDVVLHPRRTVMDIEFATLEREIATIFRTIQKLANRSQSSKTPA